MDLTEQLGCRLFGQMPTYKAGIKSKYFTSFKGGTKIFHHDEPRALDPP